MPSSLILCSVFLYFVKDISRKYIGQIWRVELNRNIIGEITGCLLNKYLRYLRLFYLMQINLTSSGTKVCLDARAIIFYVRKISILHFHSSGGFTLFATTKGNWSEFARVCILHSLSLLLCLVNSNASGWWNPGEVAGDPSESSRMSLFATIRRTKWHNTNFSVATVTLLVNKCTTTVTL